MLKKIYDKKIIMLFFIFLPVVEFITSITLTCSNINITLGMIYKTTFIIYSLIYLFFVDKKEKKYNLSILSIIFIYSIFHIFVTISDFSMHNVLIKLVEISKFICFPVSILFFHSYNEDKNIPLKTINYTALLYGLVMIIAQVTSTAFATYDSIGLEKGQSGWFVSGNELSNLLSVFLPISLYYFTKNNKIISYISLICITFGLSVIGTKTSLVGLLIGSVSLIIYNLTLYIVSKQEKTKKILYKLLVYFLIIIIIIPFTPAFKFMKERYNDSFSILCEDNSCDDPSQMGLDKFIYNGREIDLKLQGVLYYNSSLLEKIFGLNDNIKPIINEGQFNVIEQDFYDVLFIYGFVGLIVFFIPMFGILLKYINALVHNFKKNISYFQAAVGVSVCLSFGISYIAGHVFLASTVGIITAFISSKLLIKEPDNEKKKIIIYMPKLAIGGMENSLINMLNISNVLKNYDVTLVLGYLTDKEFLNKIPKYVNVRLLCNSSWNKKGKIEASVNYIGEVFYALSTEYDYSICYSYHHKVLSVLSRFASKNTILFMHTDLIKSRTKEEIDTLNKNVRFEKFKAVVCVSLAAQKSFTKLYPNYKGKVVIINNYIDGKKILSLANENIDAIDNSKISFINISRHFEKAKKITRIINSTKRLIDEGYNFNLYLVGDGEDTLKYKELVKELSLDKNVIFTGRQDNPFKFMKKSNFVIISSDFEGYGIVIDEARVLNIPIITTDIADSKKIVTKEYGIVVDNSENGVYMGMKEALDGKVIFSGNFDYNKFNEIVDNKLKDLFDSFLEV